LSGCATSFSVLDFEGAVGENAGFGVSTFSSSSMVADDCIGTGLVASTLISTSGESCVSFLSVISIPTFGSMPVVGVTAGLGKGILSLIFCFGGASFSSVSSCGPSRFRLRLLASIEVLIVAFSPSLFLLTIFSIIGDGFGETVSFVIFSIGISTVSLWLDRGSVG